MERNDSDLTDVRSTSVIDIDVAYAPAESQAAETLLLPVLAHALLEH